MRIFRIDEGRNVEATEYGGQGAYISSFIDILAESSLKWIWFDPYSKLGDMKLEAP